MSLGLVGKKIGMSRVFNDNGLSTPVTVIEITPNRICQVRTEEADGYHGVQVTVGERRPNRVTKPMKGHFSKAGVAPGRGVWEFRLDGPAENEVGSELTIGMFEQGQKVDVTGHSIGKGFAGVIKRHNFGGGRATHGNSKAHRLPVRSVITRTPARFLKARKWRAIWGRRQGYSKT